MSANDNGLKNSGRLLASVFLLHILFIGVNKRFIMKVYRKGQLRLREDNVRITVPADQIDSTVGSLTGNSASTVTLTTMPTNGDKNAPKVNVQPNQPASVFSKTVKDYPSAMVTADIGPDGYTKEPEKTEETKNESRRYRHRGNLIEGAVVFTKSELRDFLNNL